MKTIKEGYAMITLIKELGIFLMSLGAILFGLIVFVWILYTLWSICESESQPVKCSKCGHSLTYIRCDQEGGKYISDYPYCSNCGDRE